ncbi:MAG: NifU family protein [Intestinimonas sp.]|jgi:Fe-S cluster biogenesis protein NfuA|nr:NifU family protein [Intestinimonas sp.]
MAELPEIEKVLDARVRPLLYAHGGDVRVESFEDGVLKVRLLGQCSNCPSASSTTEELVAGELKAAFPEIQQVFLVTGVSDELLAEAKAFLNSHAK